MLERIATSFWGKFDSREELKKFGMLALIFGLVIGVYWTMRPMKDSIFNAIVGGKWLWGAKILSILVVAPLVVVYTKLIDAFRREKVFYILLGLYFCLTIGFMFAFAHPTIGLGNTVANPYRYIGWMWYVFVESFGSIIVALFWVLVTDMTLPEAAKRGFPVIALFGQLGNMTFPHFLNTQRLGFATSTPLVGICAGIMLIVGFFMWLFIKVTPKSLLVGYHEGEPASKATKSEEPGFLDGLKLIVTNGYLFSIFLIISIYEVIVTVIDYHFKQTAFASFGSETEVSAFLSGYATKVGIIATLSLLFGISNIQKRLGMTASLVLLPMLVAIAVVVVKMNPTSLNIVLWIMVLAKAVNYALNQPVLKQLYIPTSKNARQKAQGWIEMFGSRSSKGSASFLNKFRNALGVDLFLTILLVSSVGLIGAWLLIAMYVGKTYNTAIKNNEVVC